MRRKPGVKPAKPKQEPHGERVNKPHGHPTQAPARSLRHAPGPGWLSDCQGEARGLRETRFGKKDRLCFPLKPSLVTESAMGQGRSAQTGSSGPRREREGRERAEGFRFMGNPWRF